MDSLLTLSRSKGFSSNLISGMAVDSASANDHNAGFKRLGQDRPLQAADGSRHMHPSQAFLSSNPRAFLVGCKALKAFQEVIWAAHVPLDNVTTVSYLNCQGGTRSATLGVAWAEERLHSLSLLHIRGWYPPFALLPRPILNIGQCSSRVIQIAPVWPKQFRVINSTEDGGKSFQ